MKPLSVRTFDPVITSAHSSTTVDLSGIELVTPSGMVLLTLLLDQIAGNGLAPRIVLPDDHVRSYLARAGFFGAAVANLIVDPPIEQIPVKQLEKHRGASPLLYELTKLRGTSQVPEFLDTMWWTLKRELHYRKNDAFDFCIVLSEICQNCFDHNQDGVACLVAMQTYGGSAKRFIELAIGDSGQGIKSSLSKHSSYAGISTDVDAIMTAIRPGVSEHDDPTRGNGLDLLMRIVFKHEGSVNIRSGSGQVHVRMDKKKGWPFTVPPLSGTQVTITLPTKEAKGAEDGSAG